MLSDLFNGKQLNKSINPDEAVAYGAAVQAAILTGQGNENTKELLLLDVAALSMGIETVGGVMVSIINRNTTLPTRQTKEFTTTENGQTGLEVIIFEGERKLTKDNHKLGEFMLSGIMPAAKGTPKINVTLDVDANGIMTASAVDQLTGTSNSVTITSDKGRLSAEEIEKMVSDAAKFKDEDDAMIKNVEAINAFESYCNQVKGTLYDERLSGHFSKDDKKVIGDASDDGLKWISENKNATAEQTMEKQKKIEFMYNPIMTKIYLLSGGRQY
jgi:L1 cell adhesion molecule like protein